MLVFIIKLLAFFFISCLLSASLLFKLSVLPLLIILFDFVLFNDLFIFLFSSFFSV